MPYRLVKMYARKSDTLPVPRSHHKMETTHCKLLFICFASSLLRSHILNTNRHSSRTKLQKTYHLQSVKPGFPFILSLVSFVFSAPAPNPLPRHLALFVYRRSPKTYSSSLVVAAGMNTFWNRWQPYLRQSESRTHIAAVAFLSPTRVLLASPSFRWIYFLSV